ncbi:MAG: redoxin domain-containing protein [Clostridia bacterium]|nr:redoxin domain-containing protein [Clostridia bacterium]
MAKKLTVGDMMPNFIFNTGWKTGQSVSDEVKKADKTVFWVLRYIGCTNCRLDIEFIKQDYDRFREKNAQVYVVMQSDQDHIKNDLKEESALPFEIICDNKLEIYKELVIEAASSMKELIPDDIRPMLQAKADIKKKYGIVHGDYEGIEEQLPAMFITDSTGKIVYSHYAQNLADMPTVEEVLELL